MANISVKHRFGAPAERVYDAWLDPVQARRFLFSTTTGTIVHCEIDAHIGGRFAIVDRRDGEDVLHEGTFLELERPSRIEFTLRVPRFSAAEDRINIEIEPAGTGCTVTLTTRTRDEWADGTRNGWALILDVLDQMLPLEDATCGGGLAQNASIARRIADYLSELAETLELHRELLIENDRESVTEDLVYRELTGRQRHLANRLRDVADYLAQQRDLPMAPHDESRWSDRHQEALTRFVHAEDALASVLRAASERGQRMLASMQHEQNTPA
jgi:uncharacterized protein YndB with AHSA1/START domain